MNIDKDINEALEEVKLHKEGKIELQSYEDFEKEINIDKDKKSYMLHLASEEEIRKCNLELLEELEKKDKMIDLILGEYIDDRYDFQFIEPNKRADKRIELINEYKEHYRKKVQK